MHTLCGMSTLFPLAPPYENFRLFAAFYLIVVALTISKRFLQDLPSKENNTELPEMERQYSPLRTASALEDDKRESTVINQVHALQWEQERERARNREKIDSFSKQHQTSESRYSETEASSVRQKQQQAMWKHNVKLNQLQKRLNE